jgi:ribose-phosphate pyrophosphokinase
LAAIVHDIESNMFSGSLAVFALNSSRDFGEKVCAHLGVQLSAHEEREFEDGEHKTRPLINVRGKDVFVVQSLYGDSQQSVNDKLCRFLFFLGALRDASAGRVTAVIPYLCYARKDRRSKWRDPVTTRYVAALFEAVGVDGAVTLDVHNLAAYQNAWRIPTDHLEAKKLFVNHFLPLIGYRDVVVVSPDVGGVKRAEDFRQALSRAMRCEIHGAFLEKYRSGGVVSGQAVIGEVQGKVAVLIDDLISSGTTIVRAAEACIAGGATAVYASASHGVFGGKATATLSNSKLEQIVVTNTIPPFRLASDLVHRKLTVLDASPLFAEAIRRMHCGGSIVEFLET